MSLKRSSIPVLVLVAAISVAVMVAGCSSGNDAEPADKFPERPITLVVPYGAGGGTDIIARKVAEQAERELGGTITVVNKEGGVTVPAMEEVRKSKPDGYTLIVVSTPLSTLRHITDDVKISWQDFEPIVGLNEDLYCISVRADSEWDTIEEFVNYAKENPGKVNFGAAGPGGTFYMSVIAFLDATGIDAKIVPHPKGVSEIRTALLGGHVDVCAVGAGDVYEFVRSGQIKVLAVAGSERNKHLPDVPTLEEAGINSFPVATFRGIVGPKGIPEPVVEKLHNAFKKALESEEVVEFMKKNGLDTMYLSPSDWEAYLEEQDSIFATLANLMQSK